MYGLGIAKKKKNKQTDTLRTLYAAEPFIEDTQQQYPSYIPERPGDELYYRNYPAFHAPSVLREYIEDIRSLKIFPRLGRGGCHLEWGKAVSLFPRVVNCTDKPLTLLISTIEVLVSS